MPIHHLKPTMQIAYVKTMMQIIGRGLVTANEVDTEIRQEFAALPVGFTLSMNVFPKGPSFTLQVQENKQLKLLSQSIQKPDLTITFKHLSYAYMVLSFQESTAQAFANDRMIANGDLSHAVRLVRCLNKMEAIILPKTVARLAVKEYPKNLDFKDKMNAARQIYLKIAQSFLKRSQ
ncbi:hypothetical protein I2F27_08535 [Acinetobacter sp. B5B]|uniref:hypothetical protein n=1 Tax=Acinetobacter baretiae TaxID=2605383 RepID=UPI0018C2B2A0|nr:hypothetical protein [Acinetobacter baretiae]MBF7683370.1 hypothetical protein [Acinetobacter baretiae]MBF7684351.1 hypothetical protein [Acinetobacter baretiae]